jgi:hypothetical protein
MQSPDQNNSIRPLENILALMAAGYCLLITIMIWRSVSIYQPMWPLPGLYFIEMGVFSVLGAYAFTQHYRIGKVISWGVAGITSIFSLAGAMTVGMFYLPIALIFALISTTSDLRNKQSISLHLGICFLAGLGQVILMIAAIRLLN